MKTSLFDFTLPESLIASEPANPRDSARMLVTYSPLPVGEGAALAGVRANHLLDSSIADFPTHLRPNDIVIFNNTRVIPARLIGKRGEAKVEVLLHKAVITATRCARALARREARIDSQISWQCFAKPAKRLRVGDEIMFAPDFLAKVIEKEEDGQVIFAFESSGFQEKLQQYGHMPLPPYIEKKRTSVIPAQAGIHSRVGSRLRGSDETHYQTIYAKHDGSVAAPTAGLHFTERLLNAIDATGAKRAYVTLHVGGGTFLPVKAEDTSEHKMHSEWAEISQETADAINAAKQAGGRVVAVGTTSLRTLESACGDDGVMRPFSSETNIFITPSYRFKCVDMLLTNFHLPKSTLFMLVCAFSGLEIMQKAYSHAISNNYRFYSYGDACLLYKA